MAGYWRGSADDISKGILYNKKKVQFEPSETIRCLMKLCHHSGLQTKTKKAIQQRIA